MSHFSILLFQPEIPSNTGNIIRACANTGCALHLIRPLGFRLDDKKLRRAGLDYHEWVNVKEHDSIDAYRSATNPARILAFTTRGCQNYSNTRYRAGDTLLFGSETKGLPREVLSKINETDRLYLPMVANSRCLNLSNAVAVVLYEAWRQLGYNGAAKF